MQQMFLSPITPEQLKGFLQDAVKEEVLAALTVLNPKPENNELLTRKETAKALGISLVTLHKKTMDGAIMAHRLGSRIRYKRKDIEKAWQVIKTGR